MTGQIIYEPKVVTKEDRHPCKLELPHDHLYVPGTVWKCDCNRRYRWTGRTWRRCSLYYTTWLRPLVFIVGAWLVEAAFITLGTLGVWVPPKSLGFSWTVVVVLGIGCFTSTVAYVGWLVDAF